MQAKIADGVYLSQGNGRKLEQFSKAVAVPDAGNNFKPSSLILRLRVASAHLASEKNPFREKFCITAACADGWTSYVERRRRSDIFMSGKMQSNEYMWPFFSCHVCCKKFFCHRMSKLTRIEEAKDPECFLDFLYMKKTRHGQNIYY